MKDYDAFLFDWDGTLARTIEVIIDIFHDHAQGYDLLITRQDIARHFGDWKAVLQFGLSEDLLEQFNREVRQKLESGVAAVPLYDGAATVLQGLGAHSKKLALVTSAYREVIDKVLAHHKLQDTFALIVTAGDVSAHKPDPEGILYAIEQLGVPKRRTLMLGDSDKDLLAARNAGIDSLLFYPPSHREIYNETHLRSCGPTYVIDDWRAF